MSYLEKALTFVDTRKKISIERQKTLDMCMTATIISIRDEIIRGGKWRPSPETHAVEREIEKIEKDILGGKGTLIDFREACDRWKKVGCK